MGESLEITFNNPSGNILDGNLLESSVDIFRQESISLKRVSLYTDRGPIIEEALVTIPEIVERVSESRQGDLTLTFFPNWKDSHPEGWVFVIIYHFQNRAIVEAYGSGGIVAVPSKSMSRKTLHYVEKIQRICRSLKNLLGAESVDAFGISDEEVFWIGKDAERLFNMTGKEFYD